MNQTAASEILRSPAFFRAAAAESPKDSDYVLARAAADGTMTAIGDLYNRYSRRVYLLCLRMTCNTADAEDLTQEVFFQLTRKIGSFRGESQFSTWLYRLTVNQILMYFRHLRVLKEKATEDVEAELLTSPQSVPSVSPRILDKIALDIALTQLAPGRRQIFILHDIEGYSHEEIARVLGCSAGNSKSQLHKARLKLRGLLNA